MNQVLIEYLETESFTSLKLFNGVSLAIKDDVYVSVKNKEVFYQWIEQEGLKELFTVNYQTMSGLVKNLLIDGEAPPPGIETYFKQTITVRGGKDLE
jgi:hypothetical protein